jgi:thiamine biosynthesis lipoprotein
VALELVEHRFRAMNTDVVAWLWAEPGLAAIWLPEVESFFGEVEAELSRFRPDSGLSRLNASAGEGPQPVSAMLSAVLRMALEMRVSTDGIFDPTVLPALKAAGYDRSFELVRARRDEAAGSGSQATTGRAEVARRDVASVLLNTSQRTVELPVGVQIDLGGIAKGWTVDRAVGLLGAWGAALVDAGGDIRATAAPGGEPWPVAIEDPFHPDTDVVVVRLNDEAIATSSTLRRNWQIGGRQMHHLIDPRTGRPGESELVSASVVAPTTVRAEVAAKVALILGRDEGRAFIEKSGLDALFVDRDGRLETVGRERFEPVAGERS